MAIEIEDGKPPEWMIALENKQKRHHKLAHDIGAGAPCLNCNDGCAGLDLHFWRKICRNCKCKKEVHDVKEENSYEQFEILFGDNLKSGDRVKQLSLNLKLDDILNARENQLQDEKTATSDDNLIFDWIPTDVPANLASEYLQQLPLEKLPITGSAGAMFRRQQLQKQIPLHDFKLTQSDDLTGEETKAFEEYVDNLKNNAVGKGQITKIFHENYPDNDSLGYDQGKLPTFSNNLNATPKPFRPRYDNGMHPVTDSDSFPPPPSELLGADGLSLKTPSAFVPYKPSMRISPSHESTLNNESIPYIKENSIYDQQRENSAPVSGVAAQYSQMSLNNELSSPYNIENMDYVKQRENSAPVSGVAAQYSQMNLNNKSASPYNIENKNYAKQRENSTPVIGVAAQYSQTSLNNRSASPYTIENMNYAKQRENSTPVSGVAAQYSQTSLNNRSASPYNIENMNYAKQRENSTPVSGAAAQYSQTSLNNRSASPYNIENMNYAKQKENSSPVSGVAAQYSQTSLNNRSAAPYNIENMNYAQQRENSVPLNQLAGQYTQTIGNDDAVMDNLNYNQQKRPVDGLSAQYSHMNVNNNLAAPYTIEENQNYSKLREKSSPLNRLPAQYSQTIGNKDTNALDNKNNNWYRNNDQDEPTETLKPSDIIRKLNSRPVSPSVNASIKNSPLNKNIQPLNDPTIKNIDGKFLKMGTPEQFQALSSYVPRSPQVSNTLINPDLKYNLNDSTKTPKVHFGPSTVSVYDNDVNQAIDPYQQMEQVKNLKLQQCHHCKQPAYPGQVVVVAERAGIEVVWHPQCFVCVNCQELLVDLVYFFHKGEVYCGRHYAEELKIPRCFACDELIFVKEYTIAEGQSFHVKHFCCFECDIPLGGMQYVPKDGNPVCLSCYEIKYGKKCHYCDKMIKVGDSRVGWKELSWHAISDCFKCIQCSKSLLGGKFVVKDNKPLCSKECAIKLLAES